MEMHRMHYEQVSVASVKKMMDHIPHRENAPTADSIDLLAATGNWRQLAEHAQTETDSQKLIEIVRLLIARYDEEKNPPVDVPTHRRLLSFPAR
jgi:hypothetical protein